MPQGKKKTIKRKPGVVSKKYFDEETEEAILAYVKSDNKKEKDKIYEEKIFPATKTLAENLINVYGYHALHDSKEELRDECVSHVSQVFAKYKQEKGHAFGYFNIVTKNHLNGIVKKSNKLMKTFVSFEEKEEFSDRDMQIMSENIKLPATDELKIAEEENERIKEILHDVKIHLKTTVEFQIFDAIEKMFKHKEDLDIINKRSVSVYLRNITGLKGKQLTIPLNNIKKLYAEAKAYMMKERGEDE